MSNRRSNIRGCLLVMLAASLIWTACANDSDTSIPTGPVPITAPTGVQALAGNGTVTLSWNPVTGADNYRIRRYIGTEVDTTSTALGDVRSYEVINLTNGTTYGFEVQARRGDEEWGPASTRVTATPNVVGLPTVTVTPGVGSITVSWPSASGATRYRIEWTDTADFDDAEGADINENEAENNYVITGIPNGVTYSIRVQAGNDLDDWGTWANITSQTAETVIIGAAHGGIVNQLTVTWNAVEGATVYKVFWSDVNNAPDETVSGTNAGSALEYTITSLDNNKEYFVWVAAGNGSVWTQWAADSGLTVFIPAVTTGLQANPANESVVLAWTGDAFAVKYEAAWTDDDSPGAVWDTVEVTVTGATISSLTNGTSYSFKVRAVGADGIWSEYCTAVDAIPNIPETPPAAPGWVTVTGGDQPGQIRVTWQEPAGGETYTVRYSRSSNTDPDEAITAATDQTEAFITIAPEVPATPVQQYVPLEYNVWIDAANSYGPSTNPPAMGTGNTLGTGTVVLTDNIYLGQNAGYVDSDLLGTGAITGSNTGGNRRWIRNGSDVAQAAGSGATITINTGNHLGQTLQVRVRKADWPANVWAFSDVKTIIRGWTARMIAERAETNNSDARAGIFQHPDSLAINSDGTKLYFAADVSHIGARVVEIDIAGLNLKSTDMATVRVLPTDPGGYLRSIGIDKNNNVYVKAWGGRDGNNVFRIDGDGNAVQEFNLRDALRLHFGGSGNCEDNGDITIDNDGNIFVTMNTDGKHLLAKIIPSAPGDTEIVTGIKELVVWGDGEGGEDGGIEVARFKHLMGITSDNDGNVYVNDMYNDGKVRKIDTDGIVSTFAGGNWGNPFAGMQGLTYGLDGNFYIAHDNNVSRITPEGVVTRLYSGLTSPWGIAADANGNIYVLNRGGAQDSDRRVFVLYFDDSTN